MLKRNSSQPTEWECERDSKGSHWVNESICAVATSCAIRDYNIVLSKSRAYTRQIRGVRNNLESSLHLIITINTYLSLSGTVYTLSVFYIHTKYTPLQYMRARVAWIYTCLCSNSHSADRITRIKLIGCLKRIESNCVMRNKSFVFKYEKNAIQQMKVIPKCRIKLKTFLWPKKSCTWNESSDFKSLAATFNRYEPASGWHNQKFVLHVHAYKQPIRPEIQMLMLLFINRVFRCENATRLHTKYHLHTFGVVCT